VEALEKLVRCLTQYSTTSLIVHQIPRHNNRGQATVEFALMAPLVVLGALLLLATLSVCLDSLRLNDIARNAVRSAITSDNPADAASAITNLSHVSAVTTTDDSTGLITVDATMKKQFPLLGRWLPSLSLHGTATMMREPPVVLG
jgi:Flp pilus assembly protein TadG